MARKYQITAEVKKGDQEWASVALNRDSPMTEESLAKSFATVKKGFGNSKIDVQVRNFQCVRV
ncbi:hypothetical protein A9G15_04095 [Gilliamella apis]|uniref:DUF1187 family protein n=1 Tax=Gilliamella apis TaxID=1970738 RepID=UPI00080DB5AC|nr:DUF1187 family protein [Gilliamella apis]OCG04287.1 hypothetical protein A9G15_04095 [Gilliamella apis]